MTEAEWLEADDPEPMLRHAAAKMSTRRSRLYACAWGRLVWRDLPNNRCEDAILVAERFADGETDWGELIVAHKAAEKVWERLDIEAGHRTKVRRARDAVRARDAACVAVRASDPIWGGTTLYVAARSEKLKLKLALASFVRDLVGNPFRPVPFEARWRTGDAAGLARAIYDDRAFDRMPLLADALMDAGCDDEQVLSHCRSPGPHVRGCWVVDLVLDKH